MVKPRRRTRDNRKFYMTLGAIAIVGAAIVGYAATRPSAAETVTTVDPTLAASGAPQGFVIGSPTAPVEIVEYGDFECGWCAQFATVTEPDVKKRLVETGKARFRFVDFPLVSIHRNTMAAHLAAGCAADQGKFWEMHDRLFQGQNEWNGEATGNPKKVFTGYVKQLGLNEDAWESCFDERKHLPRIQASMAEGARMRVGSTPTFIINGKMMQSSISYDVIKAHVDSATARVPVNNPPPAASDSARAKRP